MEENTATDKNIETEAYDTVKVNGIKKLLEYQSSKGIPVYYKITIDKNDIVGRTNDIKQFDSYIGLLGSGKKLIVCTFNSPTTKHMSSRRVFDLSNIIPEQVFAAAPQALNGIETKEQWKAEADKENAARDMERQFTELKAEHVEAEEYIEKIEAEKEELKAEIAKLKEGGSVKDLLLTGIQALAQNPKIQEKIPAVAALSGLTENKEGVKEESASFSKESPAFEMSEDEKTYIHALRHLEHDEFEKGQKEWFIKIIDQLARKKEDIKLVAELLNIIK